MPSSRNGNEIGIVFVTTSDGSFPKSGSVRKQIRRQAMSKAASERKQRGNYNQANAGQYPEQILSAKLNDASQDNVPKQVVPVVTRAVPRPMTATGYERMRIDYSFDVLDLSALTSFYIGEPASQALKAKPNRLSSLMKCHQWSYFSYVPSHYGYSKCLDDAIHCIAVRVRKYVGTAEKTPDDAVVRHYQVALRTLQECLDDPVRRLDPGVLCAIEILAIYELLDFPSVQQAQCRTHVAGASALIRLRGPRRFQTEFEKALLLALVPSIFTEAMLWGAPCFLEEDDWSAVLSSAILEHTTFSDCSKIRISLLRHTALVPRLVNDVRAAVYSPNDVGVDGLARLVERVNVIRTALQTWRRCHDSLSLSTAQNLSKTDRMYQQSRGIEAIGIYLESMIFLNRISAALQPQIGCELEDETRQHVSDLFDLEYNARMKVPRASLCFAVKLVVAKATLETELDWIHAYKEAAQNRATPLCTIPWPVFERWAKLKGFRGEMKAKE
ncbi:uncharacterized protein TRIVIDRAFT_49601 [Trichoderma virens Gv29-8]|uniref:Uncharacterized protein n=1 Tax=Hypocrea virens (strain Gv29-8 / FGSC 10586) TaxID=413071 RepID=G9N2B4_HYPVG|nr:uncharacterized protein TRIVIDRAFT_49601 [Trichoderma virens Gv29-8]EHK19227.1 hypothetical protein TRIVIDRAFT_49601 [Trichoderma virens Gv29-8]